MSKLVENIKNAMSRVEVDPKPFNGDNFAIMLCEYFEDHPDCPEGGEMDEYDCWKQWAIDRHDELLQRLAEAAVSEMSHSGPNED